VKELVKKYLQEKNISIELNFGFYPYPDYEPMKFWGDNEKFKTIIHND
jgi:dTDP-6-deoxy-L-talose 4-dehydrogenase (NAD+)